MPTTPVRLVWTALPAHSVRLTCPISMAQDSHQLILILYTCLISLACFTYPSFQAHYSSLYLAHHSSSAYLAYHGSIWCLYSSRTFQHLLPIPTLIKLLYACLLIEAVLAPFPSKSSLLLLLLQGSMCHVKSCPLLMGGKS